jgi:hypothetical protein
VSRIEHAKALLILFARSEFDDFLIYDPSPGAEEPWSSSESCLWDAPEWFSYPDVLCLGHIKEYRMLSSLFKNTAEIRDVGYQDYLQYLKYMRGPLGLAPSEVDGPRIRLIYTELEEYKDTAAQQSIRCLRLCPVSPSIITNAA